MNTSRCTTDFQSSFLRSTAYSIGAKCAATTDISIIPSSSPFSFSSRFLSPAVTALLPVPTVYPNLNPTAPLFPISRIPTPTPAVLTRLIRPTCSSRAKAIMAVIPTFRTTTLMYLAPSREAAARWTACLRLW